MTGPVRILMLEDNALDAKLTLRQLASGQLSSSHCVVDTERGFRRAIRDFAPDVIISDFALPAFDGLSALQIATTDTRHAFHLRIWDDRRRACY